MKSPVWNIFISSFGSSLQFLGFVSPCLICLVLTFDLSTDNYLCFCCRVENILSIKTTKVKDFNGILLWIWQLCVNCSVKKRYSHVLEGLLLSNCRIFDTCDLFLVTMVTAHYDSQGETTPFLSHQFSVVSLGVCVYILKNKF